MSPTSRRNDPSNRSTGRAFSRRTGSPSFLTRRTAIAVRSPQRRGSASTRVTTPPSARARILRPNIRIAPGSSATKHTVCPSPLDDRSVLGSNAASSSASLSSPITRNTGQPAGKPASARRGSSLRWKRWGFPETRDWTAGSPGWRVCTITRPEGRAQAEGTEVLHRLHAPHRHLAVPGRRGGIARAYPADRHPGHRPGPLLHALGPSPDDAEVGAPAVGARAVRAAHGAPDRPRL